MSIWPLHFLMERDSPLILFFLHIQHFPNQLLGISDFGIDLITLDNLGMLGQMALVQFQYLPLKLVLFFVDET